MPASRFIVAEASWPPRDDRYAHAMDEPLKCEICDCVIPRSSIMLVGKPSRSASTPSRTIDPAAPSAPWVQYSCPECKHPFVGYLPEGRELPS